MFSRLFSWSTNASTTDEEGEDDEDAVIADWRDGDELADERGGGGRGSGGCGGERTEVIGRKCAAAESAVEHAVGAFGWAALD